MSESPYQLFISGYIRCIPPVFEVWKDGNKHSSGSATMTLGKPVSDLYCHTGKNAVSGSWNALAECQFYSMWSTVGDVRNVTTTKRCAGSEQSFVDFHITFAVAINTFK